MSTHPDTPLLLGEISPDSPELQRLRQCSEAEIPAILASLKRPFALALQTQAGQLLAVDRFAVQTLCWRQRGERLEAAEQASALGRADEIDTQAIYDYLYFHCIPSPRTIYREVFRLPPGHYALMSQGRVQVRPYELARFEPDASTRFEPARERFRQLLQDAVGRELDGSKPACFLSGGTDSSTVAGMISRASGQRAASYSIGFEAEGYDEMAFARIAAKHFDTEHHEYYVTPADLVASIPQVAAHYDQPFGNSSALPAYYCAKMAREDGVSKLLAGDGGDELFGGNARYAKQRVFGWYQSVPGPLRRGLLEPVLDTPWAARTPLLKKGSSYIEQARVPMPKRLQMYNLLLRLGPDEVLTPALRARIDAQAPGAHQQAVWDAVPAASELNRTLAFDWRYTLAESDLPKVRETTRLAGVGVGFPMLDLGLLAFSETLPDAYKLKGLKLRWFFKEALRGFLPDEILVKKKQGFGLPFGHWALRHAPLMDLARGSVEQLAQRGVLNPRFVQQLFTELLPAYPGYYGEMVWISMMLEQWLQAHAPGFRVAD